MELSSAKTAPLKLKILKIKTASSFNPALIIRPLAKIGTYDINIKSNKIE